MFQDFSDHPKPSATAPRIAALRESFDRHHIDGFIVPHGDEYQNEYLPAYAERLAWITGFTGSAGLAIILRQRAVVFVDGRYTLQVRQQVDDSLFEYRHLVTAPPETWIATAVPPGTRLGYDPHLHTDVELKRFHAAAEKAAASLIACDSNPIDSIWQEQPQIPQGQVSLHALAMAGRSCAEKRAAIADQLSEQDIDATVLTRTDSIAWLFNIRGRDVSHTPLVLAYATLDRSGNAELFIEPQKLTAEVALQLKQDARIRPMAELETGLTALAVRCGRVSIDPGATPVWFQQILQTGGTTLVTAPDPCQLPKAIKNAAELQGSRAAHVRDGAALSRFLCWIQQRGPSGEVSEIEAAKKLESFRRENNQLQDVSFDTISGSGAHGAIVHYRVTESTNRKLQCGELYLVDSGGQYQDGTTDVTRTIALGKPSPEMKDRFTRVLKGHINLSSVRFPQGTTGLMLDSLARQFLWQAGLDYDHGTGHGVGVFLGVHEGPQSISRRPIDVALQPGMIVSNEPGYYKTDAYGIRIENLVSVQPAQQIDGGERAMLSFEPLTLAPIDRNLIDSKLLTDEEIAWLDDYHQKVHSALSPLVDEKTRSWLTAACAPL